MTTTIKKKKPFIAHYLGFEIKNTWNSDGYVLIGPCGTWERSHLGNYSNETSAKKAALIYYMYNRPNTFAVSFVRKVLTGHGGFYHDFFALKRSIEADGFEIPKEVTRSDDMNFSIMFNGEKLF